MRCPQCQTSNHKGLSACRSCGNPLQPSDHTGDESVSAPTNVRSRGSDGFPKVDYTDRIPSWAVVVGIAAVCTLIVGIVMELWEEYPEALPDLTWILGTRASPTLDVRAIARSTIPPGVQATAAATATVMPQSGAREKEAASARATVTALDTRTSLQDGPYSGNLPYIESGNVPLAVTKLTLRNFVAEARMGNPFDRSVGIWDHGFFFRRARSANMRIYVDSNNNWTLTRVNPVEGKSEFTKLGSGKVEGLDTSASGSNHLRLVVNQDKGFFFVNDRFATILDVSSLMQAGYVQVGSGFVTGHQKAGYMATFQDFIIRGLPEE